MIDESTGYARMVFALIAFAFAHDNFVVFYIFYSLSAILDIADGHAARAFDQCECGKMSVGCDHMDLKRMARHSHGEENAEDAMR